MNKNKEYYLSKCVSVHGDKYSYDLIKSYEYNIYYRSKIDIICKVHGKFNQELRKHLKGSGCKKCVKEALMHSNENAMARIESLHPGKFTFENFKYNGIYNNVKINCIIHGMIEKKFYLLLKLNPCKECYNKILKDNGLKMTKSKDEFLSQVKSIHRDLYDYSKTDYLGAHKKIIIICKKHGDFKMSAGLHLHQKRGCPACSIQHSKPENKWLDMLKIPSENRGISKKIGDRDFRLDAIVGNKIYEFNGDYYHGNPSKFKHDEINKKCNKTYGELYLKTIEKKEYLEKFGYEVVSIWESDFLIMEKNASN